MSEKKSFIDAAIALGKNPLGVLALVLVFVNCTFGSVLIWGNLVSWLESIVILALLLFIPGYLIFFWQIITKHPDKLYSPDNFKDDETFLKYVNKVEKIEVTVDKIQEMIDHQPMYRFFDLSQIEQSIIRRVWTSEDNSIQNLFQYLFPIYNEKTEDDFIKLVNEIIKKTSWIQLIGNNVVLTEKGKTDLKTFIETTIARWG